MSQAMRLQPTPAHFDQAPRPAPMIGSSRNMQLMERSLAKIAASNCTVLITGETGTGKELAAEYLHHNSPRRNRPFICINCAAIPDSLLESELFGHSRGAFTGASEPYEGLLTSANGGTVFLDEIGDMSLFAQAKILRVLEKKEVCRIGASRSIQLDIRFIAATNQNLEAMTAQGTFRKDLYFRLNVGHIQVPTLRERKDDIPALLEHWSREFNLEGNSRPLEFTEACMRLLFRYDWPGNIRELKNLVECLSVTDLPSPVEPEHLPRHFGGLSNRCNDQAGTQASHPSGPHSAGNPERESLISALFWANGNKSAAAKRLRWSRMTLYRKIAKHKLFPEDLQTSNGTAGLGQLDRLKPAELQV